MEISHEVMKTGKATFLLTTPTNSLLAACLASLFFLGTSLKVGEHVTVIESLMGASYGNKRDAQDPKADSFSIP